MRRVAAGNFVMWVSTQVNNAPVLVRNHGPFEFGANFLIALAISKVGFVNLGFSSGQLQFGAAPFDERRSESYMLRPADGAVEGGQAGHRFGNLQAIAS